MRYVERNLPALSSAGIGVSLFSFTTVIMKLVEIASASIILVFVVIQGSV